MPILNEMLYPTFAPRALSRLASHLLVSDVPTAKMVQECLSEIDISGTQETKNGVIRRNIALFEEAAKSTLTGENDMRWALFLEPHRAEWMWQIVAAAHDLYLNMITSIYKVNQRVVVSPLTGQPVSEHQARPVKHHVALRIDVAEGLMEVTLNIAINLFGSRTVDCMVYPSFLADRVPELNVTSVQYRNDGFPGLVDGYQILSDAIANNHAAFGYKDN